MKSVEERSCKLVVSGGHGAADFEMADIRTLIGNMEYPLTELGSISELFEAMTEGKGHPFAEGLISGGAKIGHGSDGNVPLRAA